MIATAWRLVVRILGAIRTRWWQFRSKIELKLLGVKGAGGVRYFGVPIVSMSPGSEIVVGERVVLCSDSRYTALGVSRPVVLRTLSGNARIHISDDVGITGSVIIAATSVTIGSQCLIGADVQITDTDFHPVPSLGRRFENRHEFIGSEPIIIEDNVFLGAGVRVLKGVRIGCNSVIGAGSVVTCDIPANVIAAGIPARVLRTLPSVYIAGDESSPKKLLVE